MNFFADFFYNSIRNLHGRQLYRDKRGRGEQHLVVLRIYEFKKTGARSARESIAAKSHWLVIEDKPKKICVLKGHLFKKDFAAKKKYFPV